MMRWDIINHLIKKFGYKEYLEIGYYKGWSFDRIDCEVKTAVDPNPSKTEDQTTLPRGSWRLKGDGSQWMFKMESDDFFANITKSSKWDIIFIDGLHVAPQVHRDFLNSLEHLSDGGIIVLHDCNPSSEEMATAGTPSGEWTGDTYKTAMWLKKAYLSNFFTVDTDYGVGIYDSRYEGLTNTKVPFDSHIPWETFDRNRKAAIGLTSIEEFLKSYK